MLCWFVYCGVRGGCTFSVIVYVFGVLCNDCLCVFFSVMCVCIYACDCFFYVWCASICVI